MNQYFEADDKVLQSQLLIVSFVDLAKQRGIHPDKLLRGTALFYDDLTDPNCQLSHQQFAKLIANTQKWLPQPDIPFLLGRRLFPAQMGTLGNALMNAYSLNDMLRIIKRYQHLVFPFMFVSDKQTVTQRHLLFNQAISIENTRYLSFMCELLASVMVCAIKWRMGYLPAMTLRMPFDQPEYLEQYQAYLPCRLRFGSEHGYQGMMLSMENEIINTRFEDGSQRLKSFYINQLPKEERAAGLVQYIMTMIERRFNTNQEVTLQIVADQLNMSPATLKRKLSAHHTSYQNLLDLYRQQQAIFQLTENGWSNEQVAESLHFSDITNFRRSFKRWTGLTPLALKQRFE